MARIEDTDMDSFVVPPGAVVRWVTSKALGTHPILVDEGDGELLWGRKWHFGNGRRTLYARVSEHNGGDRVCVLLHRLIMQPPAGMVVDHVNGNGLDNRRSNLRIVTSAQNATNKRRRRDNTSGTQGVKKIKSGRWAAYINLGVYDSPEEAAEARHSWAIRIHGEFADHDARAWLASRAA